MYARAHAVNVREMDKHMHLQSANLVEGET